MHIVILFAPEDRAARDEIEKRLKPLSLRIWDITKIDVGDDIEAAYNEEYQTADIALVLVSAELISNDALMELASRLRKQRTTRMIPILLRKCFWEETVLGGLEMLPRNGETIIQGSDPQDERYFEVVSEIRTWIVGRSDSNADLPPLPKDILPPKDPYLELAWFKRADARIFFGRGEAIKTLIDLIKQDDAQVILLYGQSGVGKSSLLDAGLRPRLETEYYIPDSYREEKPDLMGAHLEALTAISSQQGKCLLILDQLEEMITNPTRAQPGRPMQFTQLLKKAIKNNPKLRILLGFRKEYLAEISTWLEDNTIYFLSYFLQPLKYDEVLDAITGVTKEKALRLKYKLEIDPEVTLSLAKDILHDKESHIAPFLQITLRKMWDAVAKQDAPVFDVPLYERFRSDSFEMLLTTQLAQLEIQFPTAVKSGLVYDILRFFTTEQETAAPQSIDEVEKNFGLVYNIREIIEAMKRLFLLTDTSKSKYYRLAHDALAPLVIRFYNNSDAPGQRATRFLETAVRTKTRLSKEAVFAVQDGITGRRNLIPDESALLNEGMRRYRKDYVKLLIRKNQIEEAIRMLQSHFEEQNQQDLLEETVLGAAQNSELTRMIRMGIINREDIIDPTTQIREKLLDLTDAISTADASSTRINISKALSAGEIDQALSIFIQFAEDSENESLVNQGDKLNALLVEYQANFKSGLIPPNTFWEGCLRVADTLLTLSDDVLKIAAVDSVFPSLRKKQLDLLSDYYQIWNSDAQPFQLDFAAIEPFYEESGKSMVFETLCLVSCRKAIIEQKFAENEIFEPEFQQNLSRMRFNLIDLCEDFFVEEQLPSDWEDIVNPDKASNIKSCVATGNIKGALTRLQSIIAKMPSDLFSERFAAMRKLHEQTKHRFRKGTIDQNTYHFNLSQVSYEILRLCDDLFPSETIVISEMDMLVNSAKQVAEEIDKVDLFNYFLPLYVYAGSQKKWKLAREIAYLFTQYFTHPSELTPEQNKQRIERLHPQLKALCLVLIDSRQEDIAMTHAPSDKTLIQVLIGNGFTEFALYFVRAMAQEYSKKMALEELDILERRFYDAQKRYKQGVMLFDLYQVTVQKTVAALLEISQDYFDDAINTAEEPDELPDDFPGFLNALLLDIRIREAIGAIRLCTRQFGIQPEPSDEISEWLKRLAELRRENRVSGLSLQAFLSRQGELVESILNYYQISLVPVFHKSPSISGAMNKKEILSRTRVLLSDARMAELLNLLAEPAYSPENLPLYNGRAVLSVEYFELRKQFNQGIVQTNEYLAHLHDLITRLQDYCRRAYA